MRNNTKCGILIPPMLAQLTKQVPTGDFAYEVKWDGVRVVAYVEKNRLRLMSRNNLDITAAYPELQALCRKFPAKSAILDGEIVALNSEGRPDFELLQSRMHVRNLSAAESLSKATPITYMIFDILCCNNTLILEDRYLDRREKLMELKLSGQHWATPEHILGDPAAFVEATRKLGVEGIMAKRCDSTYMPGKRNDAWLKFKHVLKQEFVVGGWQDGQGARKGVFGALLLGYYDSTPAEARRRNLTQKLVYAGKVGTGFSARALGEIQARLRQTVIQENPFDVDPPRERGTHFSRPELVAEIRFASWTSAHALRHASFQGLREDKLPEDVVREI